MAKPKIFVSHSTKDSAFASKLVTDLKAAGADAWVDLNDMTAGSFPDRISEAIEASEWFLLVLTQNALDSTWVRLEVNTAIYLKHQGQIRDLIFIKAEDANLKLPALWRSFHYFDATADYNDALARMLLNVGLSHPEASSTPEPRSITQRASNKAIRMRASATADVELASEPVFDLPQKVVVEGIVEVTIARGEWELESHEYHDALHAFMNAVDFLRQEVLPHQSRYTPEQLEDFKGQYNRAWIGASKAFKGLGNGAAAASALGKSDYGWREESRQRPPYYGVP